MNKNILTFIQIKRIIIIIAIIIFIFYIYNSRIQESFSDVEKCAANYGTVYGEKVCCGQPGNINNTKYVCPEEKPICKDYIYNKQWGNCVADNDSGNTNSYFDLDYINRRKCIIAVSNPSDNTYKGTQKNSLGTIKNNDNLKNIYQPENINVLNNLYDTVYVYIGDNGGVSPNNIKNSTQNNVKFLSSWEIIEQNCNVKKYLIRNIETDRFLSCGKLTKNSDDLIIYLSNKNSIDSNSLWIIESQGKNNYHIKSNNHNKYLYGVQKTDSPDFVTNSYNTPFKNNQFKEKPYYNNYQLANVRNEPFLWFIAPTPPHPGEWRSSSTFLCNNIKNPESLEPCLPNSENKEIVPYPWFNIEGNRNCTSPVPSEFFYLKKTLKPVYILGNIGTSPWGECPGFLDQQAKWIWYLPNSQSSAPGNQGAIFSYIHMCKSNTDAIINCIADNSVGIVLFSGYNKSNGKMNKYDIGTQNGGWGGSGGNYEINMQPGANYFFFYASNSGNNPNPAGLLVTVVDKNKNKIFSTGDNGWGFTGIYNT